MVIPTVLLILSCLGTSCTPSDQGLRIAAASSMRPLLEKLAAEFNDSTQIKPEFVWGSSGNLSTQIIEGAPFDLFFSASEDSSNRVVDADAAVGAPKLFCRGKLAAVFSESGGLLENILADGINYISLPNPKAAPYGIAAMSFLDQKGWTDQIDHKFVYTTSASGVLNHIEQGVADIGITAASLAINDLPNSQFTILTDEDVKSTDLPQHFLLSLNDRTVTRDFRIFLMNHASKETLAEFGFEEVE